MTDSEKEPSMTFDQWMAQWPEHSERDWIKMFAAWNGAIASRPAPAEQAALASLRHLYKNLINGAVKDAASAKRIATGLLGPAIEKLGG